MTYNNRRLLNKLNLAGKVGLASSADGEDANAKDMMSNPDYLRQSSSLINDALQKGFDVLQLANGDVVMTGVKTVVYQYSWDDANNRLVRSKSKVTARRGARNNNPYKLPSLEEEGEDA